MANKKKNTGFAIAFWLVFALVILFVFMLNKKKIDQVLKDTAFFEKAFRVEKTADKPLEEIPADVKSVLNVQTSDENTTDNKIEPITSPTKELVQDSANLVTVAPETGQKKTTDTKQEVTAPETKTPPAKTSAKTGTTGTTSAVQPKSSQEQKPAVKTQRSSVFFILIDAEGRLVRKETSREVAVSDSPMTAAIQVLLKGPNIGEVEKGYISLIPTGTSLLSASVKNGVAYLNFNDSFQYNSYGVEGYHGQLMQVVYTATAFSTVESVQFLIEGQRKEYLGSDGVLIGAPLSRASFR